ncbi:lysine transporter LysE [Terasakiispira papahanaumokuakeensis]|uniref:Lysine transporter LysE n=1 Tax=Terasakiispira papahanaumokuakeensis TaxID=197479 RepID=A0A1E2VDE9_9GAMM|nr:LysE family translocator [Terasakiispira papahanaumokuakeensis]ODC05038.1 lysine transporter LysE [Terasakiispira papahanaumokuakeensis]
MTFSAWLSIATLCTLGAISPGPSLAMILRHTVKGSRRHGIVAAFAHGIGIGLYALAAVAGVATLLHQFPALETGLTWAGAAYLAWIGGQALRSSGSVLTPLKYSAVNMKQAARDGFLTAFLSPKIAIFFIALFAPFVGTDQGMLSKIIIALTAWGIDTGWYLLVALGLSHSQLLPWLQAHSRWIDRITGIVLIAIALSVVLL